MAQVLQNSVRPDTNYYQFNATRLPVDGASPISRWISQAYTFADISASTVTMQIPPGSRVLRVRHEVDVAFTGVTAMVVGDGDTANGWIVSGVITPGTAGDFVGDVDSTFEGAGGKLYQSGDTIDIDMTGIATAGEGILFAEVISYHEAIGTEL